MSLKRLGKIIYSATLPDPAGAQTRAEKGFKLLKTRSYWDSAATGARASWFFRGDRAYRKRKSPSDGRLRDRGSRNWHFSDGKPVGGKTISKNLRETARSLARLPPDRAAIAKPRAPGTKRV